MLHNNRLKINFEELPDMRAVKQHVKAFELLFGKCEIYIAGNYGIVEDNDYVFLSREYKVNLIGRKYLTVDLGFEGIVKVKPTEAYTNQVSCYMTLRKAS